MSKAPSFATLKQLSNLKQIENDPNFSPLTVADPTNRGVKDPTGPPQVRVEENPVLRQILKNIVTQGEVNAALLNRLLEHEQRLAVLEDRLKSSQALT